MGSLTLRRAWALLASTALLVALASIPVMAGQDKVTICHKPNEDRVTISVASAAVDAHLAHGDFLGECPEQGDGCSAIVYTSGGSGDTGAIDLPGPFALDDRHTVKVDRTPVNPAGLFPFTMILSPIGQFIVPTQLGSCSGQTLTCSAEWTPPGPLTLDYLRLLPGPAVDYPSMWIVSCKT